MNKKEFLLPKTIINPHNVRTFNCSQRLLSKFTYSQFLRLLWPRVYDTPMDCSIEVAEADSGVQIDVRDRKPLVRKMPDFSK